MLTTLDHIVYFAPGAPFFVPGLGTLPGPPTLLQPLVPGRPALLVDDRIAGQDLSRGDHGVHTITTAEALSLLRRQLGAPVLPPLEEEPATPPSSPVTSLRKAATLLRVGRTTLSKRIKELPPEQRPAHSRTSRRPSFWWPSPEACLAWWEQVNAVADQNSAAVAPPPAPAPVAPTRSGGPTLVERLAALQAPPED